MAVFAWVVTFPAKGKDFDAAVLDQLLHRGHERLGDAFLEAQSSYLETGAYPGLLSIYHLPGDPALKLR